MLKNRGWDSFPVSGSRGWCPKRINYFQVSVSLVLKPENNSEFFFNFGPYKTLVFAPARPKIIFNSIVFYFPDSVRAL